LAEFLNYPSRTEDLLKSIEFIVFDFDGVFTDNRVLVLEDGTEGVMCSRSDGLGLSRLRKLGIDMMIMSTEKNPVVAARARKLKLDCVHGVDDKLAELKRQLEDRGYSADKTAFVGNDINDKDCLHFVGLGVVVADAWPEVSAIADLVLERDGGDGAVREFCDAIWSLRAGDTHE
jgi:YrbI family 3-deoxy-D-manno-octulosonate 8-phosphate phosphatase